MANNRGTAFIFPVRFWAHATSVRWEAVTDNRGTILRSYVLPGEDHRVETVKIKDCWELLRRFLLTDMADEKAALCFLSDSGELSLPTDSPKTQFPKSTPEERKRVYLDVVEKASLAKAQEYLTRMLLSGDATLSPPWEGYYPPRYGLFFGKVRAGSQAQVSVFGVFPSLLAIVQFKLVQGARFKTCTRKDCSLPFEVTSRHKRRFCSQYCAHITSLRNRRKKQRAVRQKEK